MKYIKIINDVSELEQLDSAILYLDKTSNFPGILGGDPSKTPADSGDDTDDEDEDLLSLIHQINGSTDGASTEFEDIETIVDAINGAYKSPYIIKLSANGYGKVIINQKYINSDGFTDSYGYNYYRMNSSNDKVIDDVTYYAYDEEYWGYIYYLSIDLSNSTYNENDLLDCTIYYDDSEECDGNWNDTITIFKYDSSYIGPIREEISYSAGDNQEIEVDQEILSIYAGPYHEDDLYSNASLTSIIIPYSVTSIDDYAFEDCTGLTSITIPNSVTSIGDSPIINCISLTSVYYNGTIEECTNINGWENLCEYKNGYAIHCSDGDAKAEA